MNQLESIFGTLIHFRTKINRTLAAAYVEFYQLGWNDDSYTVFNKSDWPLKSYYIHVRKTS